MVVDSKDSNNLLEILGNIAEKQSIEIIPIKIDDSGKDIIEISY